jgi:hypothetical protein
VTVLFKSIGGINDAKAAGMIVDWEQIDPFTKRYRSIPESID